MWPFHSINNYKKRKKIVSDDESEFEEVADDESGFSNYGEIFDSDPSFMKSNKIRADAKKELLKWHIEGLNAKKEIENDKKIFKQLKRDNNLTDSESV